MRRSEMMHESCTDRYSSRFQDNCFSVLRRGSKEVTYLRLVDFCITHLQAESNKEEEEDARFHATPRAPWIASCTAHLVALQPSSQTWLIKCRRTSNPTIGTTKNNAPMCTDLKGPRPSGTDIFFQVNPSLYKLPTCGSNHARLAP